MIAIINMLYLITHLIVGFIFMTIFITGYFGLLFLSLLLIIAGIITAFSVVYPDEYEYIIENYKIFYHKNNVNDFQIVISPCKQYYTFRGIHYDIAFPLHNVLNETPNSGPHHCMNCRDYGMFRGVFIMYCANCAKYVYDHNYGYGAVQSGVEMGGDDLHKSAWNSYLKHRDLTKIGLPEELTNINFNRVGHNYRVVSEKMFCNGQEKYVRWYPDFAYEYSDDEDYYEHNSDNHDSEFIKYVCEDDTDENESNHDDNEFMQNMDERIGSMD